MRKTIAVVKKDCYSYPQQVPFRPGTDYPELQEPVGSEANPVYDMVRESLHLLGLDDEHYGTPAWNPLGGVYLYWKSRTAEA